MTYCLAIELEDGLVFCSDSRTNAGPDRVSTYSKMHRFSVPYDRSLVLLTAGNLATSQAVVARLQRDLEDDTELNIFNARYVSDVAD
jgi:putative proteasome-type protease